jgi:hypothetical protein
MKFENLKFLSAAAMLFSLPACAQFGPGPRGPQGPPKAVAPVDVTGYWVSLITEDWRFRQFAAPKGDFSGVPLNQEGTKAGNTWDPTDTNDCKAYGAAGLMRVPSRFHITWQDDNTLKVESDAGTQTRLLHFAAAGPNVMTQVPAGTAPSPQGYSIATWERQLGRTRGGQGQPGAGDSRGGDLMINTSNLTAGFLRWNGAPYSDKATMTEYWDILREPDGTQYLLVKTIVHDPTYLTQDFITSTHMRKQADASGWSPSTCTAK